MNRDDLPPPMPRGHGDEPTLLAHGALPDSEEPAFPDLPDDLPDVAPLDAPPERPGTGARVTLRAIDDGQIRESTDERLARDQANLQRRVPAPRAKRPTLLPSGYDMPPKLPGAQRAPEPGLVKPVRQPDGPRPLQARARETSDVIQMFSAGAPPAVPTPMQSRPHRAPPPPPPGKLIRRAPGAAAQTQAPPPAWRPPPAVPSVAGAPGVLPLQPDRMAALVAEHRARLQTLDLFARGLEVGAGLFGAVALAVLIATLVSLLVGSGVSVVVGATALVTSLGSLALTGVMLALAAALRHLAHTGAQVAALLDALSPPAR